jgi:L-iditol 2-dehydrogenase
MITLVKHAKGKGNVELRDVAVPEIGEDDILLEVKAAGICGSDIGFYDGENASFVHPPVVLGHELARR